MTRLAAQRGQLVRVLFIYAERYLLLMEPFTWLFWMRSEVRFGSAFPQLRTVPGGSRRLLLGLLTRLLSLLVPASASPERVRVSAGQRVM